MATAAEPILASALWTPNSLPTQSFTHFKEQKTRTTGCRTVDSALKNGLDYGSITCISGESNTGVQELIQALLISHFLDSGTPTATATIIDTGLSLDVRKLHRALMFRMSDRGNAVEQEAAKVLDRVKIMKAFDFVGLTECLAELRDELEEGRSASHKQISLEQPKDDGPRGTIGDSEDEAEDELLTSPRTPESSASPAMTIKPPPTKHAAPTLLIISTLSHLALPLLKTNYPSGQALLTSCMRSLSHLTKRHNICTVLTNGVSTASAKDEAPSVFSSCALQPALGRAFGYALDLHLLVHSMKRTRGGGKASIIEVVHDRYGDRGGRWAAFTVDEDDDDTGGGLKSVS